MNYSEAESFVAFIGDDAMSFESGHVAPPLSTLVVWSDRGPGGRPLAVAIHSYLPNTLLEDDEAMELAMEGVREKIGVCWAPDYVLPWMPADAEVEA
jgi:hypothetical protein